MMVVGVHPTRVVQKVVLQPIEIFCRGRGRVLRGRSATGHRGRHCAEVQRGGRGQEVAFFPLFRLVEAWGKEGGMHKATREKGGSVLLRVALQRLRILHEVHKGGVEVGARH